MPKLTIDVENRSGAKQGEGPIESAFAIRFDNPLSAAGTFSFSVPKADPRHTLLTIKSSVVRIFDDGVQVFVGIVESLRTDIAESGLAVLNVTGRNMAAELGESSVGFLEIKDGYSARSDAPDLIMAFASGWSVTDGDATTETVYGRFAGESVLAALDLVRERTGDNWRLSAGDDRTVEWLTTFTDSGVRGEAEGGEAVALESNEFIFLITGLTQEQDGFDLVNVVYPYGAGHSAQGSGLTLAPSTYNGVTGDFDVDRANNNITYQPSGYDYPTVTKYLEFKDIEPLSGTTADLQSAGDMLAEATFRYMERYGTPQETYRVTCAKLPDDVQPGTTVLIDYYREDVDGNVIYNIDATLNVLNVATSYSDDGTPSYELVVSTGDRFPKTDSDEIAGRLAQGQIFQMHRQLSANSYRAPFLRYVGDSKTDAIAEFPFLFDTETVQVQQVLFRFLVSQLVAPTNTIGGTVVAGTTGSGGSSNPTSNASSFSTTSSGGGSAPTSGAQSSDHNHNVGFVVGTIDRPLGLTAGGALAVESGSAGNIVTANNSAGHTHTVTISDHTHGMSHTHDVTIPAHTHSVSIDVGSALSETFGVFRPGLVDTLNVNDLEYDINSSGTWTDVDADYTVLPNSYYELDLTGDVVNSTTLRPVQDNNLLQIRNRTARIDTIVGDGTTVTVTVTSGTLAKIDQITASDKIYIEGVTGTTDFNGTWDVDTINTGTGVITFLSSVTGSETTGTVAKGGMTCALDSFLKVREIIQS